MRLWLKLHKFMMGWAVLKHCCWWKRKWMSAPARAQSKISDDELFGEWQRLHYLFIWPLYNIVNCDVLKWIQTRGSVMRTYWISVRGRLNPPGSLTAHLSPSLASALVAQWHHSTHVSWPFEGHRSRLRDDVEFTFEKHEVRTSKQLSRCAPTPIKLDLWRCPTKHLRDVLELKHNTAWSALNASWMQELADEQFLPCL